MDDTPATFGLFVHYRGQRKMLFKGTEAYCASRLRLLKLRKRPEHTKKYPIRYEYHALGVVKRVGSKNMAHVKAKNEGFAKVYDQVGSLDSEGNIVSDDSYKSVAQFSR